MHNRNYIISQNIKCKYKWINHMSHFVQIQKYNHWPSLNCDVFVKLQYLKKVIFYRERMSIRVRTLTLFSTCSWSFWTCLITIQFRLYHNHVVTDHHKWLIIEVAVKFAHRSLLSDVSSLLQVTKMVSVMM